jgi:hypothetical protein
MAIIIGVKTDLLTVIIGVGMAVGTCVGEGADSC